jgi:hypothetical protein
MLDPLRRRAWTRAHGFYALTGGFVLETDAGGGYHLPESRVRLDFLTFDKLLGAEQQTSTASDLTSILNISKEDLSDKSKANSLAKSLVCLQASWFCIQCLARISQGLPLSLLEVNTSAHALSALIVYILWWDKPLDIDQPTRLPVDDENKIRVWANVFATGFCFECMGQMSIPVWDPLTRLFPSLYKAPRFNARNPEPEHEWIEVHRSNPRFGHLCEEYCIPCFHPI